MTHTALRYVDRPQRTSSYSTGRPPKYPYDEVSATLTTRQAVLMPARDDDTVARIVDAMRRKYRKQGLRLGRERHREGVLLWVERKPA